MGSQVACQRETFWFERNLAVWNENSDKGVTAWCWRLLRTSVCDLRPHQLQLPWSKRSSKLSAKLLHLALLKLSAQLQLYQCQLFETDGSFPQSNIILYIWSFNPRFLPTSNFSKVLVQIVFVRNVLTVLLELPRQQFWYFYSKQQTQNLFISFNEHEGTGSNLHCKDLISRSFFL